MATGKAITYNVKTKTTVIEDKEFDEHIKTDEELEQEYRQRVVELIGQKYSTTDEMGLNADNQLAIMASEQPSQKWIDYRVYVEECKDTAHMEVFEIERT